ncbi:kdgK, partial [Symbiodinium pilosum]
RLPPLDGDADASSIDAKIGGSALNTAVHLASILGARSAVAFYACVGQDVFGKMLEAHIQSASIKSHVVACPALCTGSCLVLSGPPGRAFVTASGAAAELGIGELQPLVEAVREAKGPVHVHFGGIYSYSATLRRDLPEFIDFLRTQMPGYRLTVSVDIQGHEAGQVAGVNELLPHIDLFKGNAAEAEAVCGLKTPEALEKLSQGRRAVVITRGASGADFLDAQGQGLAPAHCVEVKDATGAGDAFAAALLASWVCGTPLAEAVAKGCAAGALNCGRLGGCESPVTVEEIDELMASEGRT